MNYQVRTNNQEGKVYTERDCHTFQEDINIETSMYYLLKKSSRMDTEHKLVSLMCSNTFQMDMSTDRLKYYLLRKLSQKDSAHKLLCLM